MTDYGTPRDFVFELRGQKHTFKVKDLFADDIWSIQQQTQKIVTKNDEPEMVVDQPLRNKLFLSKWIADPPQTIESVSRMPPILAQTLIIEFNKVHFLDEDDLKKTSTQSST